MIENTLWNRVAISVKGSCDSEYDGQKSFFGHDLFLLVSFILALIHGVKIVSGTGLS